LTEILVSIRFSEVAGHISYVQYQPHMEIEMSKIQAVRRTLQIPFFMIKQSNDMISLIDGHDQRL
jgi:hypothetical protein